MKFLHLAAIVAIASVLTLVFIAGVASRPDCAAMEQRP